MPTPRERLFAALAGETGGPPPAWLLFPYHATGYYVDVRRHPAYRRVHEAALGRAITLDRRHFRVPLHTPEVVSQVQRSGTGPSATETLTVSWRGVRLVQVAGPRGVKRLLDSDEALEAWCALPLELDERRLTEELDAQLPAYLREKAEFPASCGAMMLDLGEPIGPLYGASRLEDYAVWSLTHDATVVSFLDRLMAQKRMVYKWCLEHGLADVYFLVGSEMASPPLVSRATFRRWIVPYARELTALIHQYGAKVIQHYHGQIREILPDFLDMAPDGLHTIEAPPVGNCTLDEAFTLTQNRITLIGNIQYDEFRRLTPPQMRAAVHDVIREAAGRRLILSPTAGPFDPAPPGSLIANYLAFLDASCG
ncbi:MAG: methylcobalamin:coenzyme M methyltransferase [Lentisphaerae bacterium ADurb.BinA184]|nr:MAG: methylcobalamin:coenzyme M methyltransferase [Lentisphaerae bacterium ADurb.BinA184]